MQTADGRRVTFPATPGPYLKYQQAVGTPGPILAVVRSESLMVCVEEIEPFLRERHELVKSGWEYMPRVQMRVSSAEGKTGVANDTGSGIQSDRRKMRTICTVMTSRTGSIP